MYEDASDGSLYDHGTHRIADDGGNHAQYGDYGPQAGDGQATISREEQQQQTVTTVLELPGALK